MRKKKPLHMQLCIYLHIVNVSVFVLSLAYSKQKSAGFIMLAVVHNMATVQLYIFHLWLWSHWRQTNYWTLGLGSKNSLSLSFITEPEKSRWRKWFSPHSTHRHTHTNTPIDRERRRGRGRDYKTMAIRRPTEVWYGNSSSCQKWGHCAL